MSVVFKVDDVVPASAPLAQTSLPTVLWQTLNSEQVRRHGFSGLIAKAGPETVVSKCPYRNPLAGAVHLAFASHRPLTLTPDVLWTTMAQGFALHIQLNAETLRGQFVEHRGKTTLTSVSTDPGQTSEWPRLVADWCRQIREHVGSGTADFFLNSFSTSGPVERTVSEIVMMDAFERYFSYVCRCICGIPRVELTGTVDDWREIRRRVELMVGYGMDAWVQRLREICDQFVESACGSPDPDFWQCMYKPREVYGGAITTGWLGRLFPYLETESGFQLNPSVTKPPSDYDWSSKPAFGARKDAPVTMTSADRVPSRERWLSAASDPSSFPNGLSRVPVTLTFLNSPHREQLELLGGLMAVVQDAETLALQPALGWAVRTQPREQASGIGNQARFLARPRCLMPDS